MTKRVILKVSGEYFGSKDFPVDPSHFDTMAQKILRFKDQNRVELVVVVGGGNIFRGRSVADFQFDRAAADYMGMLATIINGAGLREAIINQGYEARNMTTIAMPQISESFYRLKALDHLKKDYIVIISGGLGRPFVTTDTAVAHMACELNCDLVLKATNVDGIYDKDPNKHPDAVLIRTLTHQEALERRLKVMDPTAFATCQEHNKSILVFDIEKLTDLNIHEGLGDYGTLVCS